MIGELGEAGRAAGSGDGPGAGDTIVAIATAAGAGGVGIVRLSGPRSRAIAETVCGRALRPRHAHHARFSDADGETIDDGIALRFDAPRSYTGEDVVELQAHGSRVLLQRLVERCCALGARMARPGEFSERAFRNGRLDLAQAEAVADLIAAGDLAAARAARRSLDGVFSQRVDALADGLLALRVHVEAAIDFSDEPIETLGLDAVAARLAGLAAALDDIAAAAERGRRLRDGLHAVIVGPPNAGKSSLLNALAGSERAIVTDIAGTTRDVLRETIDLDGVAFTLVDTAGLREASDAVEREGVRRARAELERADVAVLVTDRAHADADTALFAGVPAGAARIVVCNKIDLDAAAPQVDDRDGDVHIHLSARSREGLDLLADALKRHAGAAHETGEGAFTARARHVTALERAIVAIDAAADILARTRAGELAAEELRTAQHHLGEITGEVSSDDLLGEIFATFCIGK